MYERLCLETGRSAVLAKLETASRELTGGALVVLLRRNGELLEVQLDGRDAVLPDFCRIYRTKSEGRKRCMTCRAQMTFGACYRGVIDYSCHGQVFIIAASAPAVSEDGSRPVVASCAFTNENRDEGWRLTRNHARDLGLDLGELHRAYYQLPRLTEERRRLVRAIVDITASAIGEIFEREQCRPCESPANHGIVETRAHAKLERSIEAELFVAHCDCDEQVKNSHGPHLVDLVMDMVNRRPGMPYSVAAIARASRMTPNHFSTVFRKRTGLTFSEFLTERRLALAKNLLRDLTLSIGEVAAHAGFSDNNYFARRFKQINGMTPMEWRKSLNSD